MRFYASIMWSQENVSFVRKLSSWLPLLFEIILVVPYNVELSYRTWQLVYLKSEAYVTSQQHVPHSTAAIVNNTLIASSRSAFRANLGLFKLGK